MITSGHPKVLAPHQTSCRYKILRRQNISARVNRRFDTISEPKQFDTNFVSI